MDKLNEFVNGSESFAGFTMNGCYEMETKLFVSLFEHFKKTGENLLDLHANLTHLSWRLESDDEIMYDQDSFNEVEKEIKIGYKMGFFDYNTCIAMWNKIKWYRENEIKHRESLINKPRRDACNYTSLKETKEYVFGKYGRKCLCCGSVKNIHIDHVVPIKKGGKDELSNLQPLCRDCNSRKGVKIIDYRQKQPVE